MAKMLVQKSLELATKIGPRQAKGHRGLQEADLGTAVIALTPESQGMDALFAVGLFRDCIGQLDLSSGALLHPVQVGQDLGRQDIAPDHGKVRRRILWQRLFHQTRGTHQRTLVLGNADNAVAAGLLRRDFHCRDHATASLSVSFDHLL
jgi:hypothetical protein